MGAEEDRKKELGRLVKAIYSGARRPASQPHEPGKPGAVGPVMVSFMASGAYRKLARSFPELLETRKVSSLPKLPKGFRYDSVPERRPDGTFVVRVRPVRKLSIPKSKHETYLELKGHIDNSRNLNRRIWELGPEELKDYWKGEILYHLFVNGKIRTPAQAREWTSHMEALDRQVGRKLKGKVRPTELYDLLAFSAQGGNISTTRELTARANEIAGSPKTPNQSPNVLIRKALSKGLVKPGEFEDWMRAALSATPETMGRAKQAIARGEVATHKDLREMFRRLHKETIRKKRSAGSRKRARPGPARSSSARKRRP